MEYSILSLILVIAGILLLAGEFVIPSGILFVVAISAIVAGLVMAFLYDQTRGWLTLVGLFIVVPIFTGMLFYYWPKTPMGRRFFLSGSEEDATLASMPVNVELEQLRGRFGRSLSDLRPAGVVDFDGRRIDTITEGMMVEAGHWVRCIDVRAGKVVVRPVEKPNLDGLENADFS